MSFCSNCGKDLSEGAKFCQNCGKAAEGGQPVKQQPMNNQVPYQEYRQPYQQPAYQQPVYQQPVYQQPVYQQPVYQQPQYQYGAPAKNIVQQLSGKVQIHAIIWLVIACLQYIMAIACFVNSQNFYGDEKTTFVVYGLFVLAVAVINTVFSVKNFKYSSEVLKCPVGILNKYSPVGNIVGTLIYNILFGGLIGIVGSIYAFVIRSFVMSNEMQFAKIEHQYNMRFEKHNGVNTVNTNVGGK